MSGPVAAGLAILAGYLLGSVPVGLLVGLRHIGQLFLHLGELFLKLLLLFVGELPGGQE